MPKTLQELTIAAHALLLRLPTEGFGLIRPLDADYARVFRAPHAGQAQAFYAQLWGSSPAWPARPDQTEFHVTAAMSEDFATNDPRAAPFPGGYREVASTFQPGLVWLLWEVVRPGEPNGITFDGLVALDDRFAWFPKPWRVATPAG